MNKLSQLIFLLVVTMTSYGQNTSKWFNKNETERIEKFLSSDALEGRKVYSKGIEMAANFIANATRSFNLSA